MGEPYFVIRIDPETREVVIGPMQATLRRGLLATGANWLIDPPENPLHCRVQIRYNSGATDAVVNVVDADRFTVEFDIPESGVAPGQAAVVYDEKDRVLGGGWIESSNV